VFIQLEDWARGSELLTVKKKKTLFRNVTQDLRIRARCSEHGNEPVGSVKSVEFLDWLSF
jgi:hypothetical protein